MGSRDQSSKRRRVMPKKTSFSDVPDGVVYRIISSIPIKDLVRFGCVSKRCRQLQLSTQSLNFHGFFFELKTLTCEQQSKLLDCLNEIFLKRVYDYRRNHRNIKSFRFSWVDHYHENQRLLRNNVLQWVYFAATCKAEEIHLDITTGRSAPTALEFPSDWVFDTCPLRYLYVNRRSTVFRTPSLTCFSNLLWLELIEVSIADEGLFKWISNCCRCITKLHIENVGGIDNFSIQSSSLKFIFIRCSNPECLFSVSLSCEELEYISISSGLLRNVSDETLCISAPNLKYLTCGGYFWNLQNVGEFLSLKKVVLWYLPSFLVNAYIENVENAIDNLRKHLWSIRMVKFLVLNSDFIEGLYKAGTPAPLVCCHHLKISLSENFTDKLVPALVSLLKGMTNLKSLHIEDLKGDPYSKSDSSAFKMLYWKVQDLVFVHQLKEVSIMLAGGSNGIMFARYILENAPHLEKMVIHHLADQSNAVRELKSGMVSNASVVFHQR